MEIHDENVLLSQIRKGDSTAFKLIYKKMYPVIANYIRLNGGSDEEARDVFQDALVVLYRKLQEEGFELTCKIQTFLYSVSRNLWLNEIRSKAWFSPESEIRDEKEDITETDAEEQDIRTRIVNLNTSIDKLGEPCASLLKMFYVQNLSMTEIASRMNYTNSDNAKNQKYKCLMRLKKIFFRIQSIHIKVDKS